VSAARREPARPLRVLCIGNGGMVYRDGHAWTHRSMVDFLDELAGQVGEVCFGAWLDPDDDPLAQAPLREARRVRHVALPRVHGSIARKLVNGAQSFLRLAHEILRADFVYLYYPGRIASVTAAICRAIGRPYGIYFRGEPIPLDPSFTALFAGARFVLSTGKGLEQIAKAHCGDVENVTPMTPVSLRDVRPPTRDRMDGPWRVLCVGRIEERKGSHDLLAALSLLEERNVPVVLTLIGHCYDVPALRRRMTDSVSKRVQLPGVIADFATLRRHYLEADAFVLPSHDEGFPRVLYEAMAFGVPIVTTFVGSVPTVMVDRENCLRVEVGSPSDIADKLQELLTTPDLRYKLACAASFQVTELMSTWKDSHALQVADRIRRAT
jgi:glycosyltransferase involved in cell wall biosynthesis